MMERLAATSILPLIIFHGGIPQVSRRFLYRPSGLPVMAEGQSCASAWFKGAVRLTESAENFDNRTFDYQPVYVRRGGTYN